MSYAVVDGCPAPAELAPILARILARSGARLQSCYRGADAEALLARLGKHSQKWLYDHQGRPEQPNAANPPGRSTHELRNDGVAYPGPPGATLEWWQCGIDVDDSHVQAFIREAAREGYTVTVTYPTSRSEYHHLNFRKPPAKPMPALKKGSKGDRVALLTKRLKRLGLLDRAYWNYEPAVAAAVRKFQKTHHQKEDGVYGAQTHAQMLVAIRALKKR